MPAAPRPPRGHSAAAPGDPRFHHLDALRASAMLAGIALHATVSFVPYRSGSGVVNGVLDHLYLVIHGVRMPLFFVLSGFFTALVHQRRGLGTMVRHRLQRVGLPFVVLGPAILLALQLALDGGWFLRLRFEATADLASVAVVETLTSLGATTPTGLLDGLAARAEPAVVQGPSLNHLWFLWFLLWFAAGYAGLVRLATAVVSSRPGRARSARSSGSIRTGVGIGLVAIGTVPALAMTEPTFGPDTSHGLVPSWPVLGYYATFFAAGAVLYDGDGTAMARLGRRWVAPLLAAVALYAIGIRLLVADDAPALSAVIQHGYAWLMTVALIGLFGTILGAPRPRVRYLSDASYWLYLAHLPLVVGLQALASLTDWPAVVLYPLIVGTAVAVLLISYEQIIRYGPVGTLLNGPRQRLGAAGPSDPPRSSVDTPVGPGASNGARRLRSRRRRSDRQPDPSPAA